MGCLSAAHLFQKTISIDHEGDGEKASPCRRGGTEGDGEKASPCRRGGTEGDGEVT